MNKLTYFFIGLLPLMFSSLGIANSSKFLQRFDQNNDEQVSMDEFKGPDKRFNQLDKNNDGLINGDEIPAKGKNKTQSKSKKSSMQLDDQFQIITVGTGSPKYNPSRSSPSTMIKMGEQLILVDMGEGTAKHLFDANIKLQNIAGFMFTHHHRDHNADAMTLLPQAWTRGSRAPVIGPEGTVKMTDFFKSFYQQDLSYRAAKKQQGIDDILAIKAQDLTGDNEFNIGSIKVKTTPVNHTIDTFAYRFETDGKAYVVSGDLTYSESLIKLAQNADVLVIDSGGIIYESQDQKNKQSQKKSGSKRVAAHASLDDVATMAQKSKVNKLVLTHFRNQTINKVETLKAIALIYKGEVVFAEDMMSFN